MNNLSVLEKRLSMEKRGNDAYLIRQALDIINRLEAVNRLVKDMLPQIGMTRTFRTAFYEVTGFEVPEWFKDEVVFRISHEDIIKYGYHEAKRIAIREDIND